jgi:NAD dependent epimerase/dehydratase family enzyme
VRVLLAGATGVIGRVLLPLLLEQGHQVSAMTRSPASWTLASGRPSRCWRRARRGAVRGPFGRRARRR